ncbi:branched-chain amino acid ABC transporter substrate-binding protein [Variovorax paradoxus]|uniref:branched-chain amino acid ABC transporter substrate-binding protein n=1 Tax=Variovorax paradoxus TaxID=34073 RepID=UPI003ECED5E0
MKLNIPPFMALVLALSTTGAVAQSGETVKIAWIDPLSGLMAQNGQNSLNTLRFFAEKLSGEKNAAGVEFEVVGIDNKLSAQESLAALRLATDQGIRYVIQGGASAITSALVDGVAKHNQRNPGKEVLFLNYATIDPDLTNSKCNFWHFRLDADTSMKMEIITSAIKEDASVKKVYLINQNYVHGHQVAKYAKEGIAAKRPDVEIVGDDLHQLAQVRDFAPYVAKIKASGADSVITGNWGSDLSLLIKAANESGYTGKFYTFYAGMIGTPTALGKNGEGKVYTATYAHPNMDGESAKWMVEFRERFKEDLYMLSLANGVIGLSEAMAKAKSTDPVKVARAFEGLKFKGFNGEVEMRAEDHQIQQPQFLSVWRKTDAKNSYDVEGTGMTFAPVKEYSTSASRTPTACSMKRP